MPKIDLKIYNGIVSIKQAWAFDIGTMLIRAFGYMFTIGTVTMLTLSGYSAFIAGTVSATLSLATFFIAPRIGKRIDIHGQSKVVPFATIAALIGLAGLILSVVFALPLPALYIFAAIIGCCPSGQALARTRWSYLIRTNRHNAGQLDIRVAYSYEGVIEDITFMLSPALNIALAAAIHPVAGMVFGGMCLACGTVILVFAKSSEPEPGWENDDDGDPTTGTQPDERFIQPDSLWRLYPERSVFRISGTVRVLFVLMAMIGIVFGSFDSTCVVFCQSIGDASLAGSVMAYSGIISAISSFIFGSLKLKSSPAQILLAAAALYGFSYATTAFTTTGLLLIIFITIASPFYAPFFITLNTVCESAVPGARLTESITWLNAGLTIGFAIGPTVSGMLMDTFGASWGFTLVGVAGIIIPIIAFATRKTIARDTAK